MATKAPVFSGLVGLLLLSLSGCVTESAKPVPGQLPSATKTDVEPRLNASTLFAHGHLLERQGAFERALEQYSRALELTPDYVIARNRSGIVLNKLGRHAQATEQFHKAIALKPGQAYLHNNLGFSLFLEGKADAAIAEYERALELNPDFARAHMNLAIALGKQQRFDEALTHMQALGDESAAYYNLGLMQTEAGRLADAATSLEKALRLNPRLEAARIQLAEVARLTAAQPVEQPEARPSALTGVTASEQIAESTGQPTPQSTLIEPQPLPPAEPEPIPSPSPVIAEPIPAAPTPPAPATESGFEPDPGSGAFRVTTLGETAPPAPPPIEPSFSTPSQAEPTQTGALTIIDSTTPSAAASGAEAVDEPPADPTAELAERFNALIGAITSGSTNWAELWCELDEATRGRPVATTN